MLRSANNPQRRGGYPEPCEQIGRSTRLNSSHVEISYAVFCLKHGEPLYLHSFPTRRSSDLITEMLAGQALLEREIKIFSSEDLGGARSKYVSQLVEQGIQSLCCVPLITRKGEVGTLNLASRSEEAHV